MPADSHVVPCGERMGPSDARDQEPKGRLTVAAECSEASNNSAAPTFRFIGISDDLDACERTQTKRAVAEQVNPAPQV